MTNKPKSIESYLKKIGNPDYATHSLRFFKTAKGEYGEGDQFLGIRVPVLRKLVPKFRDLNLSEIQKLLQSPWHEARLLALLILIFQYKHSNEKNQKLIYELYLKNSKFINNWDLVDVTAPHIVGKYLLTKNRSILHTLSKSNMLWERRIAMISCFTFIRLSDFKDAIQIAKTLLHDSEDLMHKAVGWMLREIGKRDLEVLRNFLQKYHKTMPRTMLRYSIEKLDKSERMHWMA